MTKDQIDIKLSGFVALVFTAFDAGQKIRFTATERAIRVSFEPTPKMKKEIRRTRREMKKAGSK